MSSHAMKVPTSHGFAGFWRRCGAFAVDSLLLVLPIILIDQLKLSGELSVGWIFVSAFVPVLLNWLYYASFHSSLAQATPGKRAFHIKVTDLAGRRIGFGRASARYFASLLSALILFIGFFMAAFTRRRQALHDKIAGTLVVSADTRPESLPADRVVMPLPGSAKAAVAAAILASLAVQSAPVMFEDRMVRQMAPVAPDDKTPEQLSYAIYTLPFRGEWQLVSEGTRTYLHSDVLTTPGPTRDTSSSTKVLTVAEGFDIRAHVYREARVDGFGLSITKDGSGFNWEWFVHETGDRYYKLQGPGRVQVRFAAVDGKEELARVSFLDDITMRLDRRQFIPFSGHESDRLVIRKGSVLWLSQ